MVKNMDNGKLVAPSELLNAEQQDEVKQRVINAFGEEFVKKVDMLFMALVDERMAVNDAYEFLEKVAAKYPEHPEEMVAALLVGMKFGELAAGYALQQQAQAAQAQAAAQQEPQDGAVIAPHTSYSEGMYY